MNEATVRRVHVRLGPSHSYHIEIGAGALKNLGAVVRRSLSPHAQRLAVVSNRKVFDLYGAVAMSSLRAAGFSAASWLMGDGERFKSFRTVERALGFLGETKLERSDAVIALGGGVVGDVAGFAAAIYLRGVAFVQVPTTLLAQVDSSVGGKTGVNTREGKNLVGAFHQPRAVVIDTDTLQTLPPRELTAGWCEAVKQGAAGNRQLFDQTRRFLARKSEFFAPRGSGGPHPRSNEQQAVFEKEAAALIAAQCAFKAGIVAGDEREDVGRTDHRSRRVLNFGHTIAHALEAVTRYKRFRHGEAVGYGMLAAGGISVRVGLLDPAEMAQLAASIRLAGRLPRADDLDQDAILGALASDKKAVSGHVRWVLLETIGRARIVNGDEIPPRIVRDALHAALQPPPPAAATSNKR